MNLSPRRLLRYLHRRFILEPRGMGRPTDQHVLDHEYSSGNWDHFFSWDELPRNQVLAGAVHYFYPKDPTILDLACGSGRLAQLYQNFPFARYIGADISSEGIAQATKLSLPRAEFVVADAESWEPPTQFDAIILNECIGYFADPAVILKRFTPYLKPDGRFFISVHRFARSGAQWKRLESVATVEAATAVMSTKGNVWDIKILRPNQ